MKIELHVPFKDGKPRQSSRDIMALIGYAAEHDYPFQITEETYHERQEGKGVLIRVIGTKEEFVFIVNKFPELGQRILFEHIRPDVYENHPEMFRDSDTGAV